MISLDPVPTPQAAKITDCFFEPGGILEQHCAEGGIHFELRPQQQKMAAHREMINNIRRGDTVVTQGGLVGKVTRVKETDAEIEVELNENNRVRVMRGMIAEVRTKGEPAKDAS